MTGIPPTGHQEIEFVQALTGALQNANKNIGRFNQLFGAHLNQTYIGSQQFRQLHALVSTFAQQGKWNETKCKQIKSVAKALLGQSQQPPQQQQVMAATASSSTSSSVSSTARARKTRRREEEQVDVAGTTKKSKVEATPVAASTPPSQVLPPQVANASSLFSRASSTTLRAGRHVWHQKFSILGRTTKVLGLFTTAMAVAATPSPPAAAALAAASYLLFKAGHRISQISPPSSDLSDPDEREARLRELETALPKEVKGQEYAIQEVIKTISTNLSGGGRQTSCLGCFFFAGPTGTGKTELAKTIGRTLFKEDQGAFLKLNGGDYTTEADVKKLTGAPDGYVGFDVEGGQLTQHLARHPWAILVFDEFDKVHADVRKVFLNLLDDNGGLTGGKPPKVYPCKQTIFIFTSNWAANFLSQPEVRTRNLEEVSDEVKRIMKEEKGVAPELVARLKKVLPFFPIVTREVIVNIVKKDLELFKTRNQFLALSLTFDDSLIEHLIKKFKSAGGVRDLQNRIDDMGEMLSMSIRKGAVHNADKVHVYVKNGRLAYEVLP